MNEINLRDELVVILRLFEQQGIRYALCGGLAVAVYGFPRYTKDLDFIVAKSDVPKAREAAKAAGYFIDNGVLPFPQSRFDIHRVTKIAGQDVVPLDILMLEDGDGMLERRKRAQFEDLTFSLIDLADLITLKKEADRENDRIDVAKLREIHGEG
jgi:predicted nucleotidyltransferase